MTMDLARIERERNACRANLRDAWAAMRMIREAVETLGPIGAMPAEEHLAGPTFLHEAEAIVAGIMKMIDTTKLEISGNKEEWVKSDYMGGLLTLIGVENYLVRAGYSSDHARQVSAGLPRRNPPSPKIEEQPFSILFNAIAMCLSPEPLGVHGVFIDVEKFRKACRELKAMEDPGGIA